jgi:hypothetical protein
MLPTVIMCTLGDFHPAYSLASVIQDQANAAAMNGSVRLVVQQGANAMRAELRPGVQLDPSLPFLHFKPNSVPAADLAVAKAYLVNVIAALPPSRIITHDFFLQDCFTVWAAAFHEAAGALAHHDILHMCHSGVTAREADADVPGTALAYRRNLPVGHRLLILNEAARPAYAAVYKLPVEQVLVLPGGRDIRQALKVSTWARRIIDTTKLHLTNITQVYPLSTPRALSKGAPQVIEIFAGLEQAGASVHLHFANAHAHTNGAMIEQLKRYAAERRLRPDSISFASEILADEPDVQHNGMPADDVHHLMACSNLFCFPSHSETCGLVMLEAAAAGCLLVLNSCLGAMASYVDEGDAIWVPWGAPGNPGQPVNLSDVVDPILTTLASSPVNRARRRVLRDGSLEQQAERLKRLYAGAAWSALDTPGHDLCPRP